MSHAEFTAKPGVVSEEADECVDWRRRSENAGIISATPIDPRLAEAEELARTFGASARTARGRRRDTRQGQ